MAFESSLSCISVQLFLPELHHHRLYKGIDKEEILSERYTVNSCGIIFIPKVV